MKLPRAALARVFPLIAMAGCATAPAPTPAPTMPAAGVPPAGARGGLDPAALRDAAQRLGGLRPAFRACLDSAVADAVAAEACIRSEMQVQQARVDDGLAARRARSKSNGSVDEIQAQWAAERDRLCGSDAPGVPAAQRVQAAICRLEITSARADALAR